MDELTTEMLAMLKRLEWCVEVQTGSYFCDTWEPGEPYNACPVCEAAFDGPHSPDCELAALIAKAEAAIIAR